MNDERWILANLKRAIAERHKKDRFEGMDPGEILALIAEIEAEAVLGVLELPLAAGEEDA